MSDETPSPDDELARAAMSSASDESLDADGPDAANLYVASLAVDGQATAEEQAQVEASPELLALVQSFRTMRASLQAVPVPSDAAREAAVAAALAAMEPAALVAPAPMAPPPPNVVSLERRRRWNQVLVAAAAVAVVGLAGVALAGMFSGSSEDSASTGTVLSADANTESLGSSKVGVAGGVSDTTSGTGDSAVTPGSASVTADPNVAPPQTGGETQPTETIGSIDGGASAVPEYDDPDALRSVPEPTTRVAPSFEFSCPLDSTQEIVLEITWRGAPALVVRDTVTRLITVLDPQCTTLVTVQP